MKLSNRCSLLLLLASSASAANANAAITKESDTYHDERMLQLPDLDEFKFQVGGGVYGGDLFQDKCPNQWSPLIACIIGTCPGFMDLCPPATGDNTPTSTLSCGSLEADICLPHAHEDCCLSNCNKEFQNLFICVLSETAGIDLSACSPVDCEAAMASIATDDEDIGAGNDSSEVFSIDTASWQFGVGGPGYTADELQENCPDEWSPLITCIIGTCPGFIDLCDAPFGAGATGAVSLLSQYGTCASVEADVCSRYADEDEECCLPECNTEARDLYKCMLLNAEGIVLEGCSEDDNEGPLDCVAAMAMMDDGMFHGNSTNSTMMMEMDGDPRLPLISHVLGDDDNDGFIMFGEYTFEKAQVNCPEEWTGFISCVVSNCPYFDDVCGGDEDTMMVERSMAGEELTCDDLQDDMCTFASGPDCCLTECMEEIQQVTTCVHAELSAVDLRSCDVVECDAIDGYDGDK